MTLLDTIRSLLGLDNDRPSDPQDEWFDDTRGSNGPKPDPSSEAAVKRSTDEPAAAGGDAAGSTASMTETENPDTAAEPGEAAGPTSSDEGDDLELDHDGANSDDTAATDGKDTDSESAAAGGDATASTGSMTEETNETISAAEDAEAAGPTDVDPDADSEDTAVDSLKGIGPSYSETLDEAGIETVADLAAADPETLADEIDISESRVERWTERAKARQQ